MEEAALRCRERGAAVTELYFWDGWQCVVEATTAGAVTKEYVYGEGIDEVLKARLPDAADLDSDSNTSEKVDLYYHQNSLGSVVAVTDSAGDVVESYRYSPYGEVSVFDAAGSATAGNATLVEQPFMFTGRRWDFEEGSGLYYYRLRYYDPVVGRFVQRDPLGMWGDPAQRGSGQSYCATDPVNLVDPFGDYSPRLAGAAGGTITIGGRVIGAEALKLILEQLAKKFGPRLAAAFAAQWIPGVGQVVAGCMLALLAYQIYVHWDDIMEIVDWAKATVAAMAAGSSQAGDESGGEGPKGEAASSSPRPPEQDPNKLKHLFDKLSHGFADLIKSLGSKEALAKAIQEAANKEAARLGLKEGVVETISIQVGNTAVAVKGVLQNGVFRIGSSWVI